jgi:adenylosuccinate synthase
MAKVVIGSNYGDEGKGLMTDYFCRMIPGNDRVLNIRFNGGAQAGHTVERSVMRKVSERDTTRANQLWETQRHVFHHFGSGSFNANVETFLSKFFVCNPFIFSQELNELRQLNVYPIVHVDQDCPITTPYDMMINQMVEEQRGTHRHGSCGLGFNETLQREEAMTFRLRDIHSIYLDRNNARERLRHIRNFWVPCRLLDLGIADVSAEWKERIESEETIEKYLDLLDIFYSNIRIVKSLSYLIRQFPSDRIVFEGAQGLLLDQHHEFFPYVTHSNTGLKNAAGLAQEAGLADLDVTYVTRWYATRHGAGPFPHEVPGMVYPDATNIPNDWQGTLRFGLLDIDLLAKTVLADIGQKDFNIAITCLNQADGIVPYMAGGIHQTAETESAFIDTVNKKFDGKKVVRYVSFDPKNAERI